MYSLTVLMSLHMPCHSVASPPFIAFSGSLLVEKNERIFTWEAGDLMVHRWIGSALVIADGTSGSRGETGRKCLG